jgi:hypothetical protein
MKRFTAILAFLVISLNAAQGFNNPFWTHLDKNLIKGLVKLDKENPSTIENYFFKLRPDSIKENLGFGWKMWETGIGGGYISITATFYYYHDKLVSYILRPELPDEKKLSERYLLWYNNYFASDSLRLLPYYYSFNNMLKPLDEYCGVLKVDSVPQTILDYMSPASGTMLGYGSNRDFFKKNKDNLSIQQIELIMYSINPASRFTAIEYYWHNKEKFKNSCISDSWIEKNFIEMPVIKTRYGCRTEEVDSRLFIKIFDTIDD